jgi:hypothetical protein
VIVGSYVWSRIGHGTSQSTSFYTWCSDCHVVAMDVTTRNSTASQASGKSILAHFLHVLFANVFLHACGFCICL